jgi:hypothetical protein
VESLLQPTLILVGMGTGAMAIGLRLFQKKIGQVPAAGRQVSGMIIRIGNPLIKELIQFRRDRMLSILILLAPALQLILMA